MAQTFTVTLTDDQWTYAQELATRKNDSDADVTPTVAEWETWLTSQFWTECKKRGSASASDAGATTKTNELTSMSDKLATLGVS